MRIVSLFVSLVVAVVAVCFAIANRDPVSLGLWPLVERFELPLFVAVLLAAFVAFIAGMVVAWISQGHVRRTARERGRRIQELTEQVRRLEARRAEAPAPSTAPAPALPASGPPLRQLAGTKA